MDIWIPITIAAAFFQNIRFMLQKRLTDQLSTLGVTYARFLFAAPLAVLVVLFLLAMGQPWPGLTAGFVIYASVGGIAQIVATALLVALFSLRNFAVGVVYSKTETVMTAALSAAILTEPIGWAGLAAVLVSVAGVILMSRPPDAGRLLDGLFSRAALIGVGSGAIFAVSSISYRGASLSLQTGDFLIQAAVTLAFVTIMQTLVMTVWLMLRQKGEVARVWKARRMASLVGLTGMLGSLGWFAAFALINATYVKALGQVEVLFTVLTSIFIFKEKLQRQEVAGIALIVSGIWLLLAFA
ncbi:EamA family transporter [Halovulum sp. GXIMD14793]